jgi:peptidoglycan/LPS O-acetylase OafA/YrhL
MRGLDVLRGVAVLMVLGHHRYLWQPWAKAGWAGVQLFFVLSGFLISGLLFREYQRSGQIDLRRFLIRRGLKIYPAFYVFIALTVLYQARAGTYFSLDQLLAELLFVQNYHHGVWEHTWSLAVEEHFYILLPVTLWLLCRRPHVKGTAFRRLPAMLWTIMAVTLLVRTATVLQVTPISKFVHFTPTHLNFDGLAAGVLVSFAYHLHFARFTAVVARLRPHLAVLTAACIALCLGFWREHPFMVSVGVSILNIGFCGLLILTLTTKGQTPHRLRGVFQVLGSIVAFVGVHSYAIYLWHMAVNQWGVVKLRLLLHRQPSDTIDFLLYLGGSVLFGVALTQLVERPVLAIRNRFWPSRSLPTPAADLPMQPAQGVA